MFVRPYQGFFFSFSKFIGRDWRVDPGRHRKRSRLTRDVMCDVRIEGQRYGGMRRVPRGEDGEAGLIIDTGDQVI